MSDSGNPKLAQVQAQIDDDVLTAAREAGIDVDDVVEDQIEERSGYGVKTIARLAASQLEQQVEAANSDALKGVVVGSRDRHGKNWPRRYSLVQSSGEHREVSSFKPALPGPDGTDRRIPRSGMVKFRVEHDAEYDSYEAVGIEAVKDLSESELREKLGKVAVSPQELKASDEYEVVVVQGTVAFVNPQTIFEDGEAKDDGPVVLEDARGSKQPHFEVVLNGVEGYRVRGHLERQRYGRPVVDLEDIGLLLDDASESQTPEEQASLLNNALHERSVFLVGNVNSYNTSRRDGDVRKYIDIGLTGIIETGSTRESESESSGASTETSSTGSTATGDGTSGDTGSETGDLDELVAEIKKFCEWTDTDPENLTAEMVVEKVGVDAPESVVRHAIQTAAGGAEASKPEQGAEDTSPPKADSGGSEAAESTASDVPDDPLELIRNDDGTLSCPGDGDDCLFSGSEASLYGHAQSEHNADDPKEWVEQTAVEVNEE